ncbi:MAG TPA: ADOP family duplicated permease [Thermoanaerobaculia bacterium]|nr:ADOP family duplicated permease [Thermoanaerobaculia bacterium]
MAPRRFAAVDVALSWLVRVWERMSPAALEHRVDTELREHREHLRADLERAGHSRAAARRLAEERLGDLALHRSASLEALGVAARRDSRGGDSVMSDLATETRLVGRSLWRSPGYSAMVVATLALGVAANAAIFGLLDAVLLRPLPYHEPERLVRVWGTWGTDLSSNSNPLDIADWSARSRSLEGLFGISGGAVTHAGADRPEQVAAHAVSSSWLEVLGVSPALGRSFTADEGAPGRSQVVLLEYGFWSQELGGDPHAVGRTLLLNGTPHTVVGVLPGGFPHPLGWQSPSLWRPLAFDPAKTSRGGHFLHVVGRLAPEASLGAAQAELDAITADLARQYPDTNAQIGARLESLRDGVVGDAQRTLWVLLVAVGLLLLVAALDVGALSLARQLERRHETAVRAALGASRWVLGRGVVLEGLLLGAAGGIVGLGLAGGAAAPVLRLGAQRLPWSEQARFDLRVGLFTVALALLAGLLLSLPAALRLVSPALRDFGARGRVRGASRLDARGALVVAQVALSLVLLSVATLVGQSLRDLLATDPGFLARDELTAQVTLPRIDYDTDSRLAFFQRLEERLEASAAIESVGLVNRLPLGGGHSCDSFTIAELPAPAPGQEECAEERVVTPGYFDALGLALLRGRVLEPSDRLDAVPVVVINEAMARRYWPDASPVGARFRWGGAQSTDPWREVVGVVGDVRHFGLTQEAQPEVYLPHAQVTYPSSFHAVLRSDDPGAALTILRAAVAELDPRLPIADVRTMRERIAGSVETERLRSGLLSVFSVAALLLTLLGLWGVVAFAAARRRREIGLRVALGARRAALLALMARQGMQLVLAGLALGLLGALAARRLVSGLLLGTETTDPASLAGACLLLVAAAAAAVLLPSLRALRVQPAVALRED